MQLEFEKYKLIIELLNEAYSIDKLEGVFNTLEEAEIEVRKCSCCNKLMVEGYVIHGGESYYCSDECLEKNMIRAEFKELYDNGDGDSYYTQWD
ncbi:MAG: CDP-alcohol phosphatidyltransferase [Clostridium sp.]